MNNLESRIHFIAGLPRSGSTLLSGILKQNPRFYAGMSSPLEQLYAGAMALMSPLNNSFSKFYSETQRVNILRGIVDAYFTDGRYAGKEVYFDTNRCWPNKVSSIKVLFPNAIIICCVRDVVDVLNSFERLVHENPLITSSLFNHEHESTVMSRTEILMHGQRGSVGLALNSLRDGFSSGGKEILHIVEYEDLVHRPEKTMRALYERIGEPYFGHNFNQVEHGEDEFDASIGFKGMHTVRNEVKKIMRQQYIPEIIQKKYQGIEFWR